MFYGQPRHDHVILETDNGDIFVKLLLMFSIQLDGVHYPLIMVKPLDGEVIVQDKDKDLGFYRICPGEQATELFSARDIVRGALVTIDRGTPEEFLVVDTDPDMFFRLNSMRRARFGM